MPPIWLLARQTDTPTNQQHKPTPTTDRDCMPPPPVTDCLPHPSPPHPTDHTRTADPHTKHTAYTTHNTQHTVKHCGTRWNNGPEAPKYYQVRQRRPGRGNTLTEATQTIRDHQSTASCDTGGPGEPKHSQVRQLPGGPGRSVGRSARRISIDFQPHPQQHALAPQEPQHNTTQHTTRNTQHATHTHTPTHNTQHTHKHT